MDDKQKAEAAAAAAKVEADAAAAKADADAKALADAGAPSAEIAAKDAEIKKLTEERDNYKTVALKRLGKLPADGEFLDGEKGKDVQASIEDAVKVALLDKEIARVQKEKDDKLAAALKENSELRLAAKNRPQGSIGGSGGGSGPEVKDNVFSEAQLAELRVRATRLKLNPEKYIEAAKANILSRSR